MFNKSVDSVVKSLTKIVSDLSDAVAKHHNKSVEANIEQLYHEGERDRASRILERVQGLVA